ncbi:DUF6382 domain-containing protein [Paenibacillus sp. R14(2021)]|uniref:DUF6382 domain-containing protein n=1 Tax=Paenibacillus sp. R14(2021) TaxID=2859228 RepID=UPI001C614D2A|nr:DUF6382 domain-containing protein [Paenibacillus sp. R14(2021)]
MLLDQLRIDYSMKRGHEMIVDLESGIRREQLDSIEIQMLQNQRIPKLLPVEWVDIDGGITFRYPTNGRRILEHRLQTRQLTMFQFHTLLLAVVEAMDDSRHYMLRTECFLLHEQYIFVGESWDDIALVYVPIQGPRLAASAGEAVLAMAIRWVSVIEEPDGIGLQQVFQHLRGDFVSWERLRQTLLALLGAGYREEMSDGPGRRLADTGFHEGSGTGRQPQSAVNHRAREGINQVDSSHVQRNSAVDAIHADRPEARKTVFASSDKLANTALKDRHEQSLEAALPLTVLTDEQKTEQGSEMSSKAGWMTGAGCILITAVIWRFLYLASPSSFSMLICSGLTLITCAAGLVIFRRLRRPNANTDPYEQVTDEQAWPYEEDGFVPDSMPLNDQVSRQKKQQLHQGGFSNDSTEDRANPSQQQLNWKQSRQQFISIMDEERIQEALPPVSASVGGMSSSMRAAANDATVLLGGGENGKRAEFASFPWLERQSGGQMEQIRLEHAQFIIGRSSEGVHYVDPSSGISRAHLELAGSHGSWSVKDMGSRNGSTLNGDAMVPYKTYALADKDTVQLAGGEGPKYVFRAG